MSDWVWWLVAFAALIVLAPLAAWFGLLGGRAQRGTAMAGLFFGFGGMIDPPTRHLLEAQKEKEGEKEASGDPPDPDA